MSTFEGDTDYRDNIAVVSMRGYADAENHDALRSLLGKLTDKPCRAIVLDFSKLAFLTSLAIGEIISLYRAKKGHNCAMYIAGPNEYVGSVISKTRLDATIPVYPSIDEAINALTVTPRR